MCSPGKRLSQIIRHFLVAERADLLLGPRRGLALPLRWGLIAVLISLFSPNLFARSGDPTAMLNERVYQLKPVVRSTRGLIFSLRNESGPRTQVSRQLEPRGPQRQITGTQSCGPFLSCCCLLFPGCRHTWSLVLFSQRRFEEITEQSLDSDLWKDQWMLH